jgi:serine/threonine-protein kinase
MRSTSSNLSAIIRGTTTADLDDTACAHRLWDNDKGGRRAGPRRRPLLDFSAGQIVAAKYRIDAVIGVGGMGVVLAATHIDLDQRVAIKVLCDASEDAVARFRREARLIVRLKSVHVARVFDIGAFDDDTPYIVMELLDGEDLAKHVGKGGRVGVQQAVDWILEACEAIAEAHALGMVHRDLKPANLFLARGPGGTQTVKVLDFGISKSLNEQDGVGLTNEGMALGSPGYMSPEQISSSRDVDVRSDVYSIGAILYRLTSGQSPYKGESFMSVLAAMADGPPESLRTLVPDAPPGFAAVVERCLSHDPAGRPANLAELAQVLAPFGSASASASAERIAATLGLKLPSGASEPRPASDSAVSTPSWSSPLHVTPPADGLSATIVSPITPREMPGDPGGMVRFPYPTPSDAALRYFAPPLAPAAPARKPLDALQRHAVLGVLAALALLAGALAWALFHSGKASADLSTPTARDAPAPQPVVVAPTATLLSTAVPTVTEQPIAPVVTAVAPPEIPPPRPVETMPTPQKTKPPRPPPNTNVQSPRRPSNPSAPPSPTDVPPQRH